MKCFKAVSYSFWLWFVASVIVGVVACFILDVVPSRFASPPLAYAFWGVIGVFAGFLHFSFSQAQIKGKEGVTDWESADEAKKVGGQIVRTTAAYLVGLSALFYPLFWSSGSSLEVLFLVVPDNMGVSLTYFVALLATTAFANNLFSPNPNPKSSTD